MNFNIGGPSNQVPSSYSSSSSSSDDLEDMSILSDLDEEEAIIRYMLHNYEMVLKNYESQGRHGGSIPGHIVIHRDRETADHKLFDDYFSDNPRYNEKMFRQQYRMSRSLFLRMVDAIKTHDNYFQQQRDAVGRVGLSTLQKITAALRMLAYGLSIDATDEYIKIGQSTAIENLKRFCRAIVEIFAERYLRSPNANDIARLFHVGQHRGFPGMLGSLDCVHWEWKNCPTAWARQFAGSSESPTMILEAIADYDLWIWHAYFGMPGTNNDINVMESSQLFSKLAKGIAPSAHYVIQRNEYTMGYYLANSMYPKWPTLVQTIHEAHSPEKNYFAKRQEVCRKDVERAFGALQSRFAIIGGPSRFWAKKVLHDIMTACIIMHNMIIEDERDLNAPVIEDTSEVTPAVEMVGSENARYQQFLSRHRQMKDKDAHIALHTALIEHLWEQHSNSKH